MLGREGKPTGPTALVPYDLVCGVKISVDLEIPRHGNPSFLALSGGKESKIVKRPLHVIYPAASSVPWMEMWRLGGTTRRPWPSSQRAYPACCGRYRCRSRPASSSVPPKSPRPAVALLLYSKPPGPQVTFARMCASDRTHRHAAAKSCHRFPPAGLSSLLPSIATRGCAEAVQNIWRRYGDPSHQCHGLEIVVGR